MSTSKAILKSVDMTDELLQETVECAAQVSFVQEASQVFQKLGVEIEVAGRPTYYILISSINHPVAYCTYSL